MYSGGRFEVRPIGIIRHGRSVEKRVMTRMMEFFIREIRGLGPQPRIRIKYKPAWKTQEQQKQQFYIVEKTKRFNKRPKDYREILYRAACTAGEGERATQLYRNPKTYKDVWRRLRCWKQGFYGSRWVLKLKMTICYDYLLPIIKKMTYKLFSSFISVSLVEIFKKFVHRPDLEFLWTVIPTMILFLLAMPSVNFLYTLDTYLIACDPMLTIKVIGNQWFWAYEYCFALMDSYNLYTFDSYMLHITDLADFDFRLLATDNPLVIPMNIPIRFIVTASDVLHSWAVPSLGIKLDGCPGRLNQFFSIIERVGEFYGQCSEICGVNHGFMPIEIVALTE